MKGTNDASYMLINQCVTNGWLYRAKLAKGDDSGRDKKIINNELRDVVYPKSHSAF